MENKSAWGILNDELAECKCPECNGTGTIDDAGPGDTDFRQVKCLKCDGTGFNPEKDQSQMHMMMFGSCRDICNHYHVQKCHICEDIDCGDNTSEAKGRLATVRSGLLELAEKVKSTAIEDPSDIFEVRV